MKHKSLFFTACMLFFQSANCELYESPFGYSLGDELNKSFVIAEVNDSSFTVKPITQYRDFDEFVIKTDEQNKIIEITGADNTYSSGACLAEKSMSKDLLSNGSILTRKLNDITIYEYADNVIAISRCLSVQDDKSKYQITFKSGSISSSILSVFGIALSTHIKYYPATSITEDFKTGYSYKVRPPNPQPPFTKYEVSTDSKKIIQAIFGAARLESEAKCGNYRDKLANTIQTKYGHEADRLMSIADFFVIKDPNLDTEIAIFCKGSKLIIAYTTPLGRAMSEITAIPLDERAIDQSAF